jgi:hypothetical protein
VQNTLGPVGGSTAWSFYSMLQVIKRVVNFGISDVPLEYVLSISYELIKCNEMIICARSLHAEGYFVGDRRALFERRMLDSPFATPELYLYSRADVITQHSFVDK